MARPGAAAAGLLAGWLADVALGDPRRGHPVALFGTAAARLERVLWRDTRAAGAAHTVLCVAAPAVAVWALDRGLRSPAARAVLLGVVTWAALGGRSLGREAGGVADAVAGGDLPGARRRLPALVGRDPAGLDAAGMCRAACESVAENTSDAVVAPLVWGMAAGPAGVVAYRCANTLDAMVGHPDGRYRRFGWAAARLDDVLNWAPARLTALLAAAAAPLAGGSARDAVRMLRRDGGRHPSPNAGRVEAAFAGALGVRLGGDNRYGTRVERRGPLGDGAAPDPAAVHRAVRLSQLVAVAAAVGCAAARTAAAPAARRHRATHRRMTPPPVATARRTAPMGGRRSPSRLSQPAPGGGAGRPQATGRGSGTA